MADDETDVTGLITEHHEQLDSLTHALLEAETLDAPDAYAAAGVTTRTTHVEDITTADVA
jgi:ATP-dependent Zn protease